MSNSMEYIVNLLFTHNAPNPLGLLHIRTYILRLLCNLPDLRIWDYYVIYLRHDDIYTYVKLRTHILRTTFYVRGADLVLSAKKKLGFFASSFWGLSPAERLANATLVRLCMTRTLTLSYRRKSLTPCSRRLPSTVPGSAGSSLFALRCARFVDSSLVSLNLVSRL